MKRFIIILIFAAIACIAVLFFYTKSSKNNLTVSSGKKDKDYKVLINEPETSQSKYNYVILNNHENNRKKRSAGIDFITKIKEDAKKKNPYNTKAKDVNTNIAPENDNYSADSSDVMLMARLIESEGENQPYTGKLAIGSVVMNRCQINGNTIIQTIYASGQFDGVNTSRFNEEPSSEDISAAKAVIAGTNVVPDAYYYANLKLCDPSFAIESKFTMRIGDHWFFRR